jgi:ribosome biogenesis GTPase A
MDRVAGSAETWFPGQMARTRRLVGENLSLVGLVIEVADARAPRASRHPGLERLTPGRPILTVLGKADLADPEMTHRWVAYLRERSRPGDGVSVFSESSREDAREVRRLAAMAGRRRSRAGTVRAMVMGLPNVGKSTLINRLVGRASARVGDRPGITRGKQWLDAGDELELLDLPGILVPGRLPVRVFHLLSILGILPPQAFDPSEVAALVLGLLEEAGHLPTELVTGIGSPAIPGEPPEGADAHCDGEDTDADQERRLAGLLARWAGLRGHLRGGGGFDLERAGVALLGAFRDGRFGRMTLEGP